MINECDTPANLQEISHSQVNSVFPISYCTNQNNIDDKLNWAPCILKKIQQDQYKIFDQHETFKVSKGLFWDGDEGLCNLWSTFFKYPNKKFLKALRSQIADGSNDCENSINSSNDGVDDSQPLIGVNSLISDDQIITGAGHDMSHNKDKDHLLKMIKAAQVINPQMILILTMMMLGLHLPEVKMQRVC